MSDIQDIRLQYKTDDLGNALYARVCWKEGDAQQSGPKPIGESDPHP